MVNQEGDFYRYVDTDDFFVHTTLDLGGEAISLYFTAITKGDHSQIFIMLANKDFSQLFLMCQCWHISTS